MSPVERYDDGFQSVLRMWGRSVFYSSLVVLVPLLASGVDQVATAMAEGSPPRTIESVTAAPAPATSIAVSGAVTIDIKRLDLATLQASAFGDQE